MTSYKCELCNKIFKQKIDYTRHKNKKTPCVSIDKLTKIIKKDENKKCIEDSLQTLFKSCMNIFRDYEGIVGNKALSDFTILLILKILEKKDIDISDNYLDEDDGEQEWLEILYKCFRLSNLILEKVEDIPQIINSIITDILPKHKQTKGLFPSSIKFNIKKGKTFQVLIKNINDIDFNIISSDIIGNSYESLLRDIMTGRVLGQFFTQPIIKNIMIDIIKPSIFKDGKIESIYDPAMGTGGFLLSSLDYIKKQAVTKDIKIDWEYICSEGIGGTEKENDTFQLATSNMFLSSGYICDNLKCGDSIREPTNNKYDIVLANPPFGIKGLKYDDINHHLKDINIPIKSNSAVPLFLQSIINMLKIKGRCAVVLPDGQEMFSKSNKSLVAVREYLMKTCDLKEIIYLPPGLFINTSIKTCIAYFHKKREGSDVITLHKSISKTTGKETKRTYKFCDEHQTTTVKFYDCNPEKDIKELLVEASIDKIAENKYSLNYTEYIEDESDEDSDEEGDEDSDCILWKTLGEVCDIKIGGTPSRKVPEYFNGGNKWVSVRELNGGYIYNTKETLSDLGISKSSVKLYQKDTVLFSFKLSIGKTGIAGIPLYSNEAIAGLNSKNKNLLTNKYLYHLLSINDYSKEGYGCLGNGSLNSKSLSNIKIPIPSLEQQQEIVKKLDFLSETFTQHTKKTIEYLKEKQKLYIETMCRGEETKTLEEVCDIDYGTRIVKKNNTEGKYPVYGSGRATFTTNTFNRKDYNILVGRFALSSKCVRIVNKHLFLNDSGLSVKPKTNILLHKYIGYYLLSNQNIIYECARGTAQKNLEMDIFKNIKIPIPSLEQQQEIVEKCDHIRELIKSLEKDIEINQDISKQILESYIPKKHIQDNVDIVYEDIIIEDSEE